MYYPYSGHAEVWVGVDEPIELAALDVKDEHGACVVRPRACRDETPFLVKARQTSTMCRTGGEALGGGGEFELNDQHAAYGKTYSMNPSVSADTPPDWRSLGRIPLLTTLADDRLRALWDASLPCHYAARQVLRNVGDPATQLLLLLRGHVVATATTSAGRIIRFGDFAAPCALDKIAVIDGRGHTATFTALTPCSVRSLPRHVFHALVDSAPSARSHVLRVLADYARSQQQRFAATATLRTEARLAAWLLEQAGEVGDSRVALPGTQESLADLFGVTRVTLNRALTRLRRDNLIAVRSRAVDILAPELLKLRARG